MGLSHTCISPSRTEELKTTNNDFLHLFQAYINPNNYLFFTLKDGLVNKHKMKVLNPAIRINPEVSHP